MLWIALALLLVGLAFVVLMIISGESEEITPENEIIPEAGAKLPAVLENYLGSNGVELPPAIVYAAIAILITGI